MANLVVMGAMLQCSMGASPAPLTVTNAALVQGSSCSAANKADSSPGANVANFGYCVALQICAPSFVQWVPGSITVDLKSQGALTSTSTLSCTSGGGTVSIVFPGEVTITCGS